MMIVVIAAVLFTCFCFYKAGGNRRVERELESIIWNNEEGDAIEERVPLLTRESFEKLAAINDDVVGYICFESGLVRQPVVQYSDNSYYLKHNIYKEYSSSGTVFMDYATTSQSENITLYGHKVFADDTAMFSPLGRLVDKAMFEQNHRFYFYDSCCKRTFEIISVYKLDIYEDSFNYSRTAFYGYEDFEQYISFVKGRSLVDAAYTAELGDRLMTLQTCTSNSDKRLIVCAVEVERDEY